MKHSLFKIIAPVFLAAGIAACGITDISMAPKPKLSGGFTCECTVSTAIIPPDKDSSEETQFEFCGKLSRLGTGFYELELSSPDTVAGMMISFRDGDISSSLGELSLDIAAENVSEKSPVYALFTSIDNMAAAFENGGELVSGENGGWVYQCDGLSAIFDGDGNITSMALSSPKMTADFSSLAVSDNVTETAPSTESETPSETSAETTSAAITTSSVASETELPDSAAETASHISETTSLQSSETTAASTTASETTVPITTME